MEQMAPEGYEGEGVEGDDQDQDPDADNEGPKPRNELITIAGRIYREEQ